VEMSLAFQLNQFQLQLDRYELPFIFALGNMSNLANLVVFGRRTLRLNVCSWYFICLSLTHILLLNASCLLQIVIASTGYDITYDGVVLCKIVSYLFDLSFVLSRHFLCLIAIDRWMITSSSAWLRNQSSPKITRWLIIVSVAFWSIFTMQSAIGFTSTPYGCIPPPGSTYLLFYSIYSIIVSLLPMLITSIFSILTLRNVRSSANRQIHPTQTTLASRLDPSTAARPVVHPPQQRFKRDFQLIRLSLFQIMVYLLLNSLWSVFPLYVFKVNTQGSALTFDQHNLMQFLHGIALNLLYTYMAVGLFILVSIPILLLFVFRQHSSCTHWLRAHFAKNFSTHANDV
jgi:hypothetical protein